MLNSLIEGPWQGPSAAAMAAAVTPQIAWLGNAAEQAGETGAQAVAAASAYEAAFIATVPPPEIAANRALLAALLATNFLGQNIAAIAATEAQYAELWAQDAATSTAIRVHWRSNGIAAFTPQSIATGLSGLATDQRGVNAINTAISQQGLYEIPKALLRMAG